MNDFGFLNCHKPPGMTSRDVVNIVQRRIRPTKVGHAGTLDPLAEGVLVVGVGPAVRLIPYIQQLPKHYVATFRLGASSQSGDLEGTVDEHPDLPVPTREQIDLAAKDLTGEIEQVPPAHSAIWIDGKRAYKRVRAGEDVVMPSRSVTIHSLDVLDYEFPNVALDIVCGSGTYIRTLGFDLATRAGSTAVMSHLKRVGIGDFVSHDSVSIEQLREEPIDQLLVPPHRGIAHLPRLDVNDEQSIRLGHGLGIDGEISSGGKIDSSTEAAAIGRDGHVRAIIRRKRGQWFPYRVFPLAPGVDRGGTDEVARM